MANGPTSPNPADIPPETGPHARSTRLEKSEVVIIGVLISLIAAGNILQRVLPEGKVHSISVQRGQESEGMGPIDWTATPIPKRLPPTDLNKISRDDLISIPGIGPSLASVILDHRERNGSFETLESLGRVPGIGPKRLETLARYLFVESASAAAMTPADPAIQPSPEKVERDGVKIAAPASSQVNLNQATLQDITSIPGIGEVFAARILEKREELGGFESWTDLDSIPGIGPQRLENIRRHARIR